MNRFFFVFLIGMVGAMVSMVAKWDAKNQFETIHSLSQEPLSLDEVNQQFQGDNWLDNRISSHSVNLNKIYQEKAFSRKLSNDSRVKRYQKSYGTWIEERICPESPYIDKPVKAPMTSRYGRRVHPMSGRSHVHAGIDFRGKTGTPVLAASNGVIKVARRKGAYGKAVVIDHGNSYTTLYAHLSGYAVKAGQWVNQGQTIGYIGRTGRVTGPHLHFEVRCHNVPLNPRKYLGKMGQTAEVRFKRSAGQFARRRARRNPAVVKRDPDFYTRMLNKHKIYKLYRQKVR